MRSSFTISWPAQRTRPIDLEMVRRVAKEVFVPFTVGGGIRSLNDMFQVLKAGAEKISIDSMAVRHPEIITQGALAFGRQCMVLSMQVKKVTPTQKIPSGYEIAIDGSQSLHRYGRGGVGEAGREPGGWRDLREFHRL